MEEIMHHLGWKKPCKWWDIILINLCRISSINSSTSNEATNHFTIHFFLKGNKHIHNKSRCRVGGSPSISPGPKMKCRNSKHLYKLYGCKAYVRENPGHQNSRTWGSVSAFWVPKTFDEGMSLTRNHPSKMLWFLFLKGKPSFWSGNLRGFELARCFLRRNILLKSVEEIGLTSWSGEYLAHLLPPCARHLRGGSSQLVRSWLVSPIYKPWKGLLEGELWGRTTYSY